jgi:hypothetical protein
MGRTEYLFGMILLETPIFEFHDSFNIFPLLVLPVQIEFHNHGIFIFVIIPFETVVFVNDNRRRIRSQLVAPVFHDLFLIIFLVLIQKIRIKEISFFFIEFNGRVFSIILVEYIQFLRNKKIASHSKSISCCREPVNK